MAELLPALSSDEENEQFDDDDDDDDEQMDVVFGGLLVSRSPKFVLHSDPIKALLICVDVVFLP